MGAWDWERENGKSAKRSQFPAAVKMATDGQEGEEGETTAGTEGDSNQVNVKKDGEDEGGRVNGWLH